MQKNMRIQYANNLVHRLGIDDPTTCVYHFIYDEKDKNDSQITQYYIMHGLGLCIKVDSYASHLFYAFSFSHNTAVLIAKKKKKYFPSLNINTTFSSWGASKYNKNLMQ